MGRITDTISTTIRKSELSNEEALLIMSVGNRTLPAAISNRIFSTCQSTGLDPFRHFLTRFTYEQLVSMFETPPTPPPPELR